MKMPLRLRGISGDVKGKVWESDALLRAGRLSTLEIVLDDSSVSRRHAEVRQVEANWWIRDLDSTNGTYVNGVRLDIHERRIEARDIIQFGKVAMMVEVGTETGPIIDEGIERLPMSEFIVVSSINASWEEGLERLAFDRDHHPRPAEQLATAIRAKNRLAACRSDKELLESVLNASLSMLDAHLGMIVTAENTRSGFRLRERASTLRAPPQSSMSYDRDVAERCFGRGESVLYSRSIEWSPNWAIHDFESELMGPQVLCILLRTQQKRFGVLYLERSGIRSGFNDDDLHFADGLAAYLSAGIACAHSCNPRIHNESPPAAEPIQNDPDGLLKSSLFNPAIEKIVLDSGWLTSDVVDLAQAIRSERGFERMPLLADALVKAGCDNEEIIRHCWYPGFHLRGCRVLDSLIGRNEDLDSAIMEERFGTVLVDTRSRARGNGKTTSIAIPVKFNDDELFRCAQGEIASRPTFEPAARTDYPDRPIGKLQWQPHPDWEIITGVGILMMFVGWLLLTTNRAKMFATNPFANLLLIAFGAVICWLANPAREHRQHSRQLGLRPGGVSDQEGRSRRLLIALLILAVVSIVIFVVLPRWVS